MDNQLTIAALAEAIDVLGEVLADEIANIDDSDPIRARHNATTLAEVSGKVHALAMLRADLLNADLDVVIAARCKALEAFVGVDDEEDYPSL